MKTQEQYRMVGAEIALLLTMVEVSLIVFFVPEFQEYAKVLCLPFFAYGLFYVFFVDRKKNS